MGNQVFLEFIQPTEFRNEIYFNFMDLSKMQVLKEGEVASNEEPTDGQSTSKFNFMTIKSCLENEEDKFIAFLQARVKNIAQRKYTYQTCIKKNHRKPLLQDKDGTYLCTLCNKKYTISDSQVRLPVLLSDKSRNYWATFFFSDTA